MTQGNKCTRNRCSNVATVNDRYGNTYIKHWKNKILTVQNHILNFNVHSAATIETIILVDVDDDWTTTVTTRPIIKPVKGFLTRSDLKNSVTDLP